MKQIKYSLVNTKYLERNEFKIMINIEKNGYNHKEIFDGEMMSKINLLLPESINVLKQSTTKNFCFYLRISLNKSKFMMTKEPKFDGTKKELIKSSVMKHMIDHYEIKIEEDNYNDIKIKICNKGCELQKDKTLMYGMFQYNKSLFVKINNK